MEREELAEGEFERVLMVVILKGMEREKSLSSNEREPTERIEGKRTRVICERTLKIQYTRDGGGNCRR